MIIIRTACRNDLADIVMIYNQAVKAGFMTADMEPVTVEQRQKWFDEHLPNKHPIFVAEENNKVIGWLSLSPYRPGRKALQYTQEVSYYINFDSQGKGVASRLLQHAIDQSPKLNIKTLFAILISSNIPSIKLLEKFHFEKWGEFPRVANYNGIEVGQVYYGLRIAD